MTSTTPCSASCCCCCCRLAPQPPPDDDDAVSSRKSTTTTTPSPKKSTVRVRRRGAPPALARISRSPVLLFVVVGTMLTMIPPAQILRLLQRTSTGQSSRLVLSRGCSAFSTWSSSSISATTRLRPWATVGRRRHPVDSTSTFSKAGARPLSTLLSVDVPPFRFMNSNVSRRWVVLSSSSSSSSETINTSSTFRDSEQAQEKNGETIVTTTGPSIAVPPSVNISSADDEPDLDAIQHLTATWKENPVCNPTIHCKSWIVTDGKVIQTILHSNLTQPYLASQVPLLQHLRHRVKLVREVVVSPDGSPKKLILLHPDTPSLQDLPLPVRELLRWTKNPVNSNDKDTDDHQQHQAPTPPSVTEGPILPLHLTYDQFTASHLLDQLLPPAVHPPPTAFETVGHVAHLNLRPPHVPYRHLIGQVLLVANAPHIATVVHKLGPVDGPHRTYALEVVAGRPDTSVQLQENGIQLHFDLAHVYWCSRLSQERQRLLEQEILVAGNNKNNKNKSNNNNNNNNNKSNNNTIILADPFCGVGALCLQAAAAKQHNVQVWANDWNPHAVQALRDNAARNGLLNRLTQIQCGDAYDFLMDLGLASTTTTTSLNGDRNETRDNRQQPQAQQQRRRLPDHVVMNFPLHAPEFLGALRWWPASSVMAPPRVHVYTFARAAPPLSARDVAVNTVADALLPRFVSEQQPPQQRPATATTRSKEPRQRLQELNDEYGCNVRVHHVRDVAPGKMVYCVSFSATPKLLRCMQGDFV